MLEGSGDWHHPVHIHFEEGRILTRNGQPPPGPARRQARLAQADGRRTGAGADAGAGRPGQPQRGRTVLFNMMQSVCAGICPANTANLLQVQQALGSRMGKDIFMVSMTLQPEFDTPDALREYVGRYGIQPGWTFLTGPPCRCSAARPAVLAAGRRPVPTRSGRRAGTGSWSAGLPVYWPSAQIGVSVVTACQD
ncbi:MAG: SCO family protein [Polaromonas sp.]|nr:SCO family protein [Polaromonas sp.]